MLTFAAMKRKIFSILAAIGLFAPLSAQPIDSLFYHTPDNLMPFLEGNSRLDLLDLYNCGMKAEVSNDLNGQTVLLEKDSLHFRVQTTASSDLAVHLLSLGKDTLLACVRTVHRPRRQSEVFFYTPAWDLVKIKSPFAPSLSACWQPTDSLTVDRQDQLRQALQPLCFYAEWKIAEGREPQLEYRLSTEGLVEEDRKAAAACLRPIVYVWRNNKLVKVSSK